MWLTRILPFGRKPLRRSTATTRVSLGDIVIALRTAAAGLHNRDKLMLTAYDGVGSLSMATIERFRDVKVSCCTIGLVISAHGIGTLCLPMLWGIGLIRMQQVLFLALWSMRH
jgi:hypothetical protein